MLSFNKTKQQKVLYNSDQNKPLIYVVNSYEIIHVNQHKYKYYRYNAIQSWEYVRLNHTLIPAAN